MFRQSKQKKQKESRAEKYQRETERKREDLKRNTPSY